MKKTEWFNRKFPPIDDNGILPSIIERLAGTPARLEEITRPVKEFELIAKLDNKWSIKEEAGHMSDLEPLWFGRLADLLNERKELRTTDLTNQLTHFANHNSSELEKILNHFRSERQLFVTELMKLNDKHLNFSALHPRLKTPMRIVDLAYFVAEHDDHHLARIRQIIIGPASVSSTDHE